MILGPQTSKILKLQKLAKSPLGALLKSYEHFKFFRNFGTKTQSSGVQKSFDFSSSDIWYKGFYIF